MNRKPFRTSVPGRMSLPGRPVPVHAGPRVPLETEGREMLKVIIAVVLVAHGIGHSLGLLQVFRIATVNPAWHGDSWILTGLAGPAVTSVVGAVLWTAAIVGFAAVGGVVLGWLPASWWEPLAIGSAVVSLLGVLCFPSAFPTTSTIGAVAVDLAVLAAVLVARWAPADLLV